MTLYGYARVSVREPEDKNLDLQVERLVRAGCATGNIRAEEASGAKNDRGGLLELLDLVVEGDTLVVTHIDRLSRGLTYGLQVIEGLHHAGVEFRSLAEDFDTSTPTGKLQLQMVLAFSEWWRNSIRDRSVAGQAKARVEGRFPGRRPSLTEQQRDYIVPKATSRASATWGAGQPSSLLRRIRALAVTRAGCFPTRIRRRSSSRCSAASRTAYLSLTITATPANNTSHQAG